MNEIQRKLDSLILNDSDPWRGMSYQKIKEAQEEEVRIQNGLLVAEIKQRQLLKEQRHEKWTMREKLEKEKAEIVETTSKQSAVSTEQLHGSS